MRLEQWTKAREAAFKGMELDPLNSANVLKLAVCYENEKQFIKAHDWYARGICFVPAMDRTPDQLAKLERLAELAKDQEENVVRKDPFDILPLELLIKIMQYHSAEQPYWSPPVILRCTWVSQRWRNTMIGCSDFWNTLMIPGRELKDTTKAYHEKREAWIKRSGGKFHTMDIGEWGSLSVTLAGKIPKTYNTYFAKVKDLRLGFADNRALFRFAKRFPRKCGALQHLTIEGGDMLTAKYRDDYRENELHCGFLNLTSYSTLKSLNIKSIDLSERDIPDAELDDHYFGRLRTAKQHHDVYPDLTRLTVTGSIFNVFAEDLDPDAHPDTKVDRWMACPLHRTLLGADRLQYLKVICDDAELFEYEAGRTRRQTVSRKKITRTDLHAITLPPPVIFAVDISAPNVKSLDYAFPLMGHERSAYERTSRPVSERLPLIPAILDSPVVIDNMAQLIHLGFECCSRDTLPRFEEWLSRVPNLVSLSLHGVVETSPMVPIYSYQVQPDPPYPDNRVDVCVLDSLIKFSEQLPKLTDVQLIDCETPDDRLLEFVKMRQDSPTVTPLTRLFLHGRKQTRPSPATHVWLHKAIPRAREDDGRWSKGFSHSTGFGTFRPEEDHCDCHDDGSILSIGGSYEYRRRYSDEE
jgi:hypothetical protein